MVSRWIIEIFIYTHNKSRDSAAASWSCNNHFLSSSLQMALCVFQCFVHARRFYNDINSQIFPVKILRVFNGKNFYFLTVDYKIVAIHRYIPRKSSMNGIIFKHICALLRSCTTVSSYYFKKPFFVILIHSSESKSPNSSKSVNCNSNFPHNPAPFLCHTLFGTLISTTIIYR